MPEPVCLTASVISLISASAKLSLTFYQVADVIISSKEDISTLAAEISIFSQCLSMFGRAVEQLVSKIEGFKEIAEKLIESTRDVIIDAKVINNIAPRWLSEDPERRLPFVGRLKWLFSKSKVITLRNNVESLKTTLLTLISVVEYTESRKNDSSEDIQ